MFGSVVAAFKQRARKYPGLVKARNAMRSPSPPPPSGREVIAAYMRALRQGDDLKILFGGHWSNNPGWLLLNEQQQDVTGPLDVPSNAADVVFCEHVIEHVPFTDGVHFLQELFRILKPGGVCRIVCPMLDRVLRDTLGLDGINEEPLPFLFSGLYMNHGHRFIWTSGLMIKVMKRIGFTDARRYAPGEGSRPADCIERRRRGIYLGNDWREELTTSDPSFDVESFVVEAVK